MTNLLDDLFHAALVFVAGLLALASGAGAVVSAGVGVFWLLGDPENVMQQQAQGSLATAHFALAGLLLAAALLFGWAAMRIGRE